MHCMDRLEQLVRNAKTVQSRLIATGTNIRTILFDTHLSIVSVENTTELATRSARSGQLREALLNWGEIRQIWASDQVFSRIQFEFCYNNKIGNSVEVEFPRHSIPGGL